VPIYIHIVSAILCFLFSAIFHLFYTISPKFQNILSRLDYSGISILITGSCFAPNIYGY